MANPLLQQMAGELHAAHRIIGLSLNLLQGDLQAEWLRRICAADLEGQGVTRHHEREALLRQVDGATGSVPATTVVLMRAAAIAIGDGVADQAAAELLDVYAQRLEHPHDGVSRIAAERARQVWDLGLSPRDDLGRADDLAAAGACYALPLRDNRRVDAFIWNGAPEGWPWQRASWHPTAVTAQESENYRPHPSTTAGRVRELAKAGALLAAAIDALLAGDPPTPSQASMRSGGEASNG